MSVEYFDVVDEQDRVIGRATREECHAGLLPHRTVHVLVYHLELPELALQRRGPGEVNVGKLTSTATGHVLSGESYADAAARELGEEAGIQAPLREVGKFQHYTPRHKQHGTVYVARSNGPFVKGSEVEEFLWLPPSMLRDRLVARPEEFTSTFLKVAEQFRLAERPLYECV